MNVLLISKRLGCSSCLSLGKRGLILWLLTILIVFPLVGGVGGFFVGEKVGRADPHEVSVKLEAQVEEQKKAVEEAKRNARDDLNALALRLGKLQAHVMRLDALGDRITRMAKLDDGEFDFSAEPAQGGPGTVGGGEPIKVKDFIAQLTDLSRQLDDRSEQLQVLEAMLRNHSLQKEIVPAGRPIKKGWLSSYFGMRTDPFTGKQEMHEGMDFAGKEGSDVIAAASGVVTWAGPRWGYGNLVEINHGNGYSTRYGHNEEVLVKVGQMVKKGDVVAHMGSTGRSTGPHCHFEVRINGRPVNPQKYIQATR